MTNKLLIAEAIRDKFPDLKVMCHCGEGSLKSQLKKAKLSGAETIVVIKEEK